MGFLDSILGGGNNASQAPPPSVDQQHSMLQSVLAMIQSSKLGGLQGLIQRFQNAGLGHLMSGWISSGPNPPISPNQLQSALGDEHIKEFAQQHNMTEQQATNTLSQLLPHVVDNLTPQGNVPQHGIDWGGALSMLKSKLMQ